MVGFDIRRDYLRGVMYVGVGHQEVLSEGGDVWWGLTSTWII